MASEGPNENDGKRSELKDLKSRMAADETITDDLFFFPKHDGVNGFLGTDSIWFVGPKPSEGNTSFPTNADELLYETLGKFGFQNAHVTDFSKERGPVPDDGIPHEEVARQRPYFRQEVNILEPDIFIAMTRRMEVALKYLSVTEGIEISYVHHYSWANGRGDEEVFVEDIKNHAEKLGMDY